MPSARISAVKRISFTSFTYNNIIFPQKSSVRRKNSGAILVKTLFTQCINSDAIAIANNTINHKDESINKIIIVNAKTAKKYQIPACKIKDLTFF